MVDDLSLTGRVDKVTPRQAYRACRRIAQSVSDPQGIQDVMVALGLWDWRRVILEEGKVQHGGS